MIDEWADSCIGKEDENRPAKEKMAILTSPPNEQGACFKFYVSKSVWEEILDFIKPR